MRRAFSVSTFIVNDGAVLLILHRKLGLWLPVGGEIEQVEVPHGSCPHCGLTLFHTQECPNYGVHPEHRLETPLEAARREVKEETGLDVYFPKQQGIPLQGEPPGLIGYEEHEAGDKGTHMNFCFVALSDSRKLKSDGSFTDHIWHDLREPFFYPTHTHDSTPSVAQCVERVAWLHREKLLTKPEGN